MKRTIKKPKSKLKYSEAGGLNPLNQITQGFTSATNLAGGLQSTISNWDESTKTQKAANVFNTTGDAFGTLKSIPGLGLIGGIGEGASKLIGSVVGMFPGKDGKKQAREDQNEQTRLNKFQSGTMFSKDGGTLPSSEYKILPSNKSSRKAPIQKLTKDMEIVSQSGQFSHNSNDDIPVDTNNDNQEDLRMEGGEIILKQKDGGQYMLNKKISKILKPKALALSKGDKISQNTLEKYLKPEAVKRNDANLVSKGLTDRLSASITQPDTEGNRSVNLMGGTVLKGNRSVNGEGGTTKPTVTLSPNSYNKLAKDKPVTTPQEFQKYLVDTGRANIKTYTQGIPDKGAQVRKEGGKLYTDAGGFNQEDLVKSPTAISGFNFNEPQSFRPKFSITSPDLYQNLKTNQITKDLQFNKHYNQTSKITDPTDFSLLKNESPSNKDGYKTANGVTQSNVTGNNPSGKEGLTTGETIAGTGAMLGTGLKALALKRNKSLPINSSYITNRLARKQGKAEGELRSAENESIQRVQGSVNRALDTTSYPSVPARLANNRNTIKAGASAEADVRSKFALGRSGLMSQNASTLAGLESQNYFATNDRRQQEIDKRTQGWMDISQDLTNNSISIGNLANARKYRQDIYDSPVKWNGSSYEVSKVKHGGKIKRPKKLK